MKVLALFGAFLLIIGALARPDDNLGGSELHRVRRVTCDLLSISTPWGSLNHAACAANCIRLNQGYTGGRCIDGVCNCRR